VWDCITTVEVLDSNAESWGFQFVETDTSRGITTVTIDQILRDNSDTVPFIIKIDIEGGEQNLFRSDTDWMERFKVIVIEMHDWLLPFQDTSRNALRALSRSGRDYLHKGENTFWIQR
jgi:hypothetical protein